MKRKYAAALSICLLSILVCAARAAATPASIAMEDLARMLRSGEKINLLDVRTPEEYAMFHLKGAVNINSEQIADRLEELRGRDWILYCRTSRRAGLAADILDTNGFANVRYVKSGMADVPMFVKKYNTEQPELAAAIQDAVETMYPVAGFRHPVMQLETVAGRGVDLFKAPPGKTVVMIFWRPGVPGDAAFFDQTLEFAKKNKDMDFVPIVFGAADSGASSTAYKGDIFLDPGNAAKNFYGLEDPPMLVLVDARGILRAISFTAPDAPLAIYGNKSFAQLAREAADGAPMAFPDVGIYAVERDPLTLKGKTAADFTLPDEMGVSHSLSEVIGKPVALIFFSINCQYCQKQLIALSEYQKKHANDMNVQVIALTMNGGIEYQAQVMSFTAANDIAFPVLYDETGTVMAAYNVASVPVWMALDKQGIVGMVTVGYQDNTEALLDETFAGMGF